MAQGVGGSEEGVKGADPLCSRKPACNFTAGLPYWQFPIYGFNQLQFKPMLFKSQLFYLWPTWMYFGVQYEV